LTDVNVSESTDTIVQVHACGTLRIECQHCKAKFFIGERLSRSSTQTFFIDVAVQANVGSERFGDIDTDVMTDLRQMLQLNKSYVRSFVSVDEQLQSGLLQQSVSLELLAFMSLACSLSTVLQRLIMSVPITAFCEVTWQGQAVTALWP